MKTAIRFFALFVAVIGLASASMAPARTQIPASHHPINALVPGPDGSLPGPINCQLINTCVAPASVTR